METVRALALIVATIEEEYSTKVSAAGVSLLAEYIERYSSEEVEEAVELCIERYDRVDDFFKKIGGTLYNRWKNSRDLRATE